MNRDNFFDTIDFQFIVKLEDETPDYILCDIHKKFASSLCECGNFLCKDCIFLSNKHENHGKLDIKNERNEVISCMKKMFEYKVENLNKIFINNQNQFNFNTSEIEKKSKEIDKLINEIKEMKEDNRELMIKNIIILNFNEFGKEKVFSFFNNFNDFFDEFSKKD